MNMKKLFAGAVLALLGLPATANAQTDEPVYINGSVLTWYYYGKDIHSSTIGWNEVGPGSVDQPSNIGLMTWGIDATRAEGKQFVLTDFPIRHNLFYGNAGGVFTGDAYYTFSELEVGWEDNLDGEVGSESYQIVVRKWTWEVDSVGNYTNLKYQNVGKIYNNPTDLTYDPLNDIVYGVFTDNDGNYKLGTLDMSTLKITYISRESMALTGELRTLACNSKGELYGTDKSGNVYQVNTTDGSLRTIGNMGFPNQQKMQSAAFDYRTDKLYWLGYMNNGKISAATDGTNNTLSIADGGRDTGLYEINTETGEATLIGDTYRTQMTYDVNGDPNGIQKERGFQLTGIYVVGSIMKHANDLRAFFRTSPIQMKNGETGTNNVTVAVKNVGTDKVRGSKYVVNLYADGELIGTIDDSKDDVYTDNLDAGESQDFTFSYSASTVPGTHVLKVEVTYADDQELRNNSAETTVRVLTDKMLPQVKLEGVKNGNGIDLSWENPNGRIIEGAEEYVAFTYDGLGEWTMVDGDKGYTQKPQNFNSSINFANWSTPKAFIVFDPIKAGFDLAVGGEKWNAYQGSQYFAAFWSAAMDDAGGHEIDNSDYMVSPELSGDAQTISFWAKGYRGYESTGYATEMAFNETVEVLYTTDAANLDPTTYEVAVAEFSINDVLWTQYTADLPAGAMHFAIHRTSKAREYTNNEDLGTTVEIPGTGSFVMMIDNIEFFVKPREVKGYNLYKNGKFVEQLSADQTAYSVKRASTSDEYTMTVVYDDGESNPSNAMSIDYLNYLLGIEPVVAAPAAEGIQIFNMRGQRVASMQRPGLYIVKKDGKTRKVMVK